MIARSRRCYNPGELLPYRKRTVWRLRSESNRRRRLCRPLGPHEINGVRTFCHTLTPQGRGLSAAGLGACTAMASPQTFYFDSTTCIT